MAADPISHKDITLLSLPCAANKFLETVSHTFKSVLKARAMKPDLLHIHAIGPSLFAPLAKALGMKVVMTTHGPDYERAKWSAPAKAFLKFCERMGMTYADEVIAISGSIAEDIKRKYGKECHIIPNGVEVPIPVESAFALEKFDLKAGKYILAVGRLVPEKGFHDLIEAFDRSGMRGWKLVIVGRADHEDSYSENLRDRASLNPDVVMTGFLKGKALQELYSHAGIFAIPSYYEGLPIVLLEAMSYGLPCIASDIPANRNVKLPESHFFRTGDIKELSIKLSQFSVLWIPDQYIKAQINMIERDYNWDTIADRTMKVYQKAAAGIQEPMQC